MFVVLFGIFKIPFICYAELSIPTRDFALRVPQAKPTNPETYVSIYMIFLLCNIKMGFLGKIRSIKIKNCFIVLLFLGLYSVKT